MRDLFLRNADVVLAAVGDERVSRAWDDDSVLADQSVGSLVGHLARGSVWVVADYLDADPPDATVDIESAADYFASVADSLTSADHAAIRERGLAIATKGYDQVVAQLADRIAQLGERLPREPLERTVSVYGGHVMRLDDYLTTRLVEQVVHLDDLARSLAVEAWESAPGADAVVVGCGAEIGRRRFGGTAMIRTLFRAEDVSLPVL